MDFKITNKEKEVLKIFWHAQKPLSVSDVVDIGTKLSKNTIPIVVKNLYKKKYLEVDHIEQKKKALARVYTPTISEEQFIINDLSEESIRNLFSAFIENNNEIEELEEIKNLINQRKNELKGG